MDESEFYKSQNLNMINSRRQFNVAHFATNCPPFIHFINEDSDNIYFVMNK